MLEDFDNPDGTVTAMIMAEVASQIEEAFEDSQSSDFYNEILDVIEATIVWLDQETDEDGNLDLAEEGLGTFRAPSGALAVDHTCTGWGDTETNDPENGTLTLALTLGGGNIGALVWGFADDCKYLVRGLRASYDGDIAVYFGRPVAPSEPIAELESVFAAAGTIGFGGVTASLNEAFRITESGRFDLLIRLRDRTSFIYFFESNNPSVQGIIDVTGTFACNLERRECVKSTGTFSW
ncbi:MAG: hypothetical protein HKN10_08895 [Myxococcales bacterium]|nr:hypothetical protein [Myxococcales bacterium]